MITQKETEKEFNAELTPEDIQELSLLVKQGYTNGILDGEGYRISWRLEIEKFEH